MYNQKKPGLILLIKIMFVIGGIAVGFVITRIFIVPFNLPDNSMEPLLMTGDTILFLRHVAPKQGDVVLIESPLEPGQVLIKRVAASEGDTVEIRDKVLFINNAAFIFPWKTNSA